MSRLEACAQVDPAAWNLEAQSFDGCPFHSYEWSLFSAGTNTAVPLYLRWFDENGQVRAMGIALEREKAIGAVPFYKTLSLGSLPVRNNSFSSREMLETLSCHCRGCGFVSLDVHSFGTPIGTEVLQEVGFKVSKRWEFLVTLEEAEEEQWKKIHSKKRNLIRKGQKEGLLINRVFGLQELWKFRALAVDTYNRKKDRSISFPRPAGDTYYNLLKERLLDTGIGRLYMAYEGDHAVGGAFFVGLNGAAYYMLSSASEEGLRKAAPDLIVWTAMADYLKEGFQVLNLGGLSEMELNGQPLEESGLYHFKKRFSADVHPCYKGTLILRPRQFKIYSFLKALKSRLF